VAFQGHRDHWIFSRHKPRLGTKTDTRRIVVPKRIQEKRNDTMPSQAEIRQAITNQIVEALQKGGLPPWRQSWCNDPNCGQPANITSQKTYRGINPLLLQIASMRHGFKTRWWATYRQWDTL